MNIFTKLKDKIARYVDVQVRLLKITLIGRTANILSYFMFALICLFIGFSILIFLGRGLVELYVYLGMSHLGAFFGVTGTYALFLFLLIALRKKVVEAFSGVFIRILTEADDHNGDDDDDEDENNEAD
jgi:hypothetical protein